MLKVLQDVADNDKRTQALELMSSVVWKGKSATLMSSLADAMVSNTKVTAINLSDCNIGDNGLCSLADAIKENGTVRPASPHTHHHHRAHPRLTRTRVSPPRRLVGSFLSSISLTINSAAPG